MEDILTKALAAEGWTVVRAHAFDAEKQHGFIDSQAMGMRVFRELDPAAPLIVAESVWQYSHHVLHGLFPGNNFQYSWEYCSGSQNGYRVYRYPSQRQ